MAGRAGDFADSVFINCPFDEDYWSLFEAIVFTVVSCGFRPRCALEDLDSGTVRLRRITSMLRVCRYGIHDLSRIELGPVSGLPRFNMPFELGLDIAAQTFGNSRLKRKRYLILDSRPYRYQAFISDISGQDIQHHSGSPERAIDVVRNWLRTVSKRKHVQGPLVIKKAFGGFTESLPENCDKNGLDRNALLFVEYVGMATQWIEAELRDR